MATEDHPPKNSAPMSWQLALYNTVTMTHGRSASVLRFPLKYRDPGPTVELRPRLWIVPGALSLDGTSRVEPNRALPAFEQRELKAMVRNGN